MLELHTLATERCLLYWIRWVYAGLDRWSLLRCDSVGGNFLFFIWLALCPDNGVGLGNSRYLWDGVMSRSDACFTS